MAWLFFVAAYCDFNAVALLGASISRIILFTFPLIVIVLEAIGSRTLPARSRILAFTVAYGGLALVTLPTFNPDSPVEPVGLIYSLIAATVHSIFWLRSQRLTRAFGSVRFNAVCNTATCFCGLAILTPTLTAADLQFSSTALGWTVVIAIFCTAVPFFLMFEGIRRVGASEAGVLTLFGPALTIAMAWLVLGEQLGPLQWVGFGVVMLGMAILKGLIPRKGLFGPAKAVPESRRNAVPPRPRKHAS